MLHQLPGGGNHLAVLSVATDSAQRRAFGRLGYMDFREHCALLANSVSKLAVADAVCLFLPYTFLVLSTCALYSQVGTGWKFALAAASAVAGNYSFVQGNLIWLVTLPLILWAPGVLEERTRRKFVVS